MFALKIPDSPLQVSDDSPQVLARILEEGVNLAVWQRRLSEPVSAFCADLLAGSARLAESLSLEFAGDEAAPVLHGLAHGHEASPGHAEFLEDVAWLTSAYACLVDARRVGLRLRALDGSMCPRFHVDQVPLRLVTTYAGPGSQWLAGGLPHAEVAQSEVRQLACGDVALLKGEKWLGNEGRGIVHRSPQLPVGQRRLLLTLDWLA